MPIHNLFEIALAYNAMWRGHSVRFVGCDGLFQECDMVRPLLTGPRSPLACQNCKASSQAFFQQNYITPDWLGRYEQSGERNSIQNIINAIPSHELMSFKFEERPIADWISSSVHTHFRSNKIDLSNAEHERVFRSYLAGGILASTLINRMYRDIKPDCMLLFNGRMSYTKVALELALEQKIEVLVHERGFLKNTISIFKNTDCLSTKIFKELWNEWGTVPLLKYELDFSADWIRSFSKGKNLSWRSFISQTSSNNYTHFIKKYIDRKIWCLFPSSTDEMAATDDFYGVYKNQNDWIEQTVEFVRKSSGVALIIRCHPNMGSKTSEGVNRDEWNYFASLKSRLPDNVYLILPDAPVNSYDLLERCDLGLVFISTMSIEMACRGIPVIAGGLPGWADAPMIQKISSPDSYDAMLLDAEKNPLSKDELLELAKGAYRLAYAYSQRGQIRMPIYKMPDPYKAFLLVNSTEDFKPGKCPELDYATDVLLGERPAIPKNTRVIKPEDFDEEDEAIREALARFDFFKKAEKLGLLTVILDARGEVSLIYKSIESIAGQFKRHADLIIILPERDDAFQKTAEILLSEIPQDRIQYVRVPNEEEKAVARNLAIKQADGEFVICIEAGEVLSANYFKYFASALDANSHADVFYSKLVKTSAGRPELITPPRYVNLNMQAHRNYFTSGAMVRKSLWESIGGYRESIKGIEDWDFYLAALLRGAKFQYMDCPGIISSGNEKQVGDNPHIHQSSVYAQMVLNNLAAFSLLEINTARTKLGLPPLDNVPVAKYQNAIDFKISELCDLKEEGKKPNWTNEEMAALINRLLQIRSWELACYMCECLLDREPQNKQLLAVYAQVLQATGRSAESAIIQDQINNGREFPAISVVPLSLEKFKDIC
jgi:glycosyltransferase involved in cell wall biosynthesis